MTQEDLDKLSREYKQQFSSQELFYEDIIEGYQAGFKKALELVILEKYNIELMSMNTVEDILPYL